jgi:AcrR family transcriptional regulator
MNAQARRLRYRQELRETILEAARELFVRDGYESFSMRKLAERLGCSHGSIYLHFRSKEELFDSLVERSFAQLFESLRALERGGRERDPVRLLKRAARAYVDFGLRNPGAYEFAFLIRRSGPARPWRPHAALEYGRELIRRCVEAKRFRAVDAETAGQAIWAAIHGVTSLLLVRPTFPWVDRDKLIKQVLDSAVDSLVAGPGPARGRGGGRGKREPG